MQPLPWYIFGLMKADCWSYLAAAPLLPISTAGWFLYRHLLARVNIKLIAEMLVA